jgi:hypothetical protein
MGETPKRIETGPAIELSPEMIRQVLELTNIFDCSLRPLHRIEPKAKGFDAVHKAPIGPAVDIATEWMRGSPPIPQARVCGPAVGHSVANQNETDRGMGLRAMAVER